MNAGTRPVAAAKLAQLHASLPGGARRDLTSYGLEGIWRVDGDGWSPDPEPAPPVQVWACIDWTWQAITDPIPRHRAEVVAETVWFDCHIEDADEEDR